MPKLIFPKLSLFFGLLLIFLISSPSFLYADNTQVSVEGAPNVDQMIEGWQAELNQIGSALERESITQDELGEFRERLTTIRISASRFSDELTPELRNLSDQLQKLNEADNATLLSDVPAKPAEESEASGEGEESSEASEETQAAGDETVSEPAVEVTSAPEDDAGGEGGEDKKPLSEAEKALNEDITELGAKVTKLNAQLGRAQVVVLRSEELITNITELRRTKFTDRLFERGKPLVQPLLWISSLKEVPAFFSGLLAIWSSGSNRVLTEAPTLFFAALIGGMAFVFLVLKLFAPLQLTAPVARGVKLHNLFERPGFNAIKQVTRSLLIFAFVPALIVFTLSHADVLAARLSTVLWTVLGGVVFYAVGRGLSKALLAPYLPAHRLVSMSDKMAQYTHTTIMVCLTIALVGYLVVEFGRTLVISLDFISLTYGITAVSFAGFALYRYFTRPREEGARAKLYSDILAIRLISIFVIVSLFIALIAPFFGYPNFAAFSVGQVILAGIIAVVLYICFTLIDGYLGTEIDPSHDGGVSVIRAPNDKEQRTIQLMMLFSGLSKIVLTLLGVGFFAASWGLDTTGIWDDLLGLFREIKIGEFSISPAVIITSLIVLAIGILATRSIQSWLSTRFLPTTRLDVGLRNSIVTGMGYIGIIVSAMIAFSQAGLDLSNLAIVAGALSLGIGFGLQSIVSNFVSGIILLAERPIKAGDWISVGSEEGTVRKINVRSTEIETFDRATVIVPNADFISSSVKNMMYGNKMGRFIIPVGVGYDSDPDEVRDALMEVAHENEMVLKSPGAYVVFMDFGASSLDFQLRGFIADCDKSLTVRSDLRFAIFRKLKERGIEIPFPQRDLNIKGLDGEKTTLVTKAIGAKASGTKATSAKATRAKATKATTKRVSKRRMSHSEAADDAGDQ